MKRTMTEGELRARRRKPRRILPDNTSATVKFPLDELAAIDAYATELRLPRSVIVREACRRYLKQVVGESEGGRGLLA